MKRGAEGYECCPSEASYEIGGVELYMWFGSCGGGDYDPESGGPFPIRKPLIISEGIDPRSADITPRLIGTNYK